MKRSSVVRIDPEIMSGAPCFTGTRWPCWRPGVPVRTLLDYLEGGDSLDEFLEDFPTVVRAQAIAFLEHDNMSLVPSKMTRCPTIRHFTVELR
jgi:uncharacterized protein (DUF433 family)